MARTTEKRSKLGWRRRMTSSSIRCHRRENHHLRRLMIVQWHLAVLAVATKRKRENVLFASRGKKRRRRNLLTYFSHFQRKTMSTQRQNLIQKPNSLTAIMDLGIVSNVLATACSSFMRKILASEELLTLGLIDQLKNHQSRITLSSETSVKCRNEWRNRWNNIVLTPWSNFDYYIFV